MFSSDDDLIRRLCTQFWLEHVESYVVQAKYVFYLQ